MDAATKWLHKGKPRDTRTRAKRWDKMCTGYTCHFLGRMHRLRVPAMLQRMNYSGSSAEVGVWQGEMSHLLMKHWRSGGRHLLVDPWKRFDTACQRADAQTDARTNSAAAAIASATEGRRLKSAQPRLGALPKGGDKQCRFSQTYFDRVHNRTRDTLTKAFPGRVAIDRAFSVDAARRVADASLSFLHIDARHDYDGVLEDLRAWWPKLCPGGVLAGHDWTTTMPPGAYLPNRKFPVAIAIGDFLRNFNSAEQRKLGIFVTADHPASFFLFKQPAAPCAAAV